MVECNLEELARILGCSVPTARKLTQDYADMPVIERGGLGSRWRFNADDVVAFLQRERAKEQERELQRNEALAQLTLPIAPKDADTATVSLDDQIKASKLRQLQRDELKESRFLVPTLEVRAALERAFRRYGQLQESALARVSQTHNLPEAVKRAIEREFAEARIAFVKDAAAALATQEPHDEPASLFG